MTRSAVLLRDEARDAQQMLRSGSSEMPGDARLLGSDEWKCLNGIEGSYRQGLGEDLPDEWTTSHFAERLVQAFKVIERQQGPKRPKKPGNHWPETKAEWADRLAWCELPAHEQRERDQEKLRKWSRATLTRQEIYRADLIRGWVADLRDHRSTQGIVVSRWGTWRALNLNVSELCAVVGWRTTSFYRWRDQGIEWIVSRLNERCVEVF